MHRVIIESPFAGDTETNIRYARACVRDSLDRGEAPYASHLLYTQPGVLDDTNPDEREWGINAGFQWRAAAHYTVVYTDLGISRGMQYGIDDAVQNIGHRVEYRTVPGWVEDETEIDAAERTARLATYPNPPPTALVTVTPAEPITVTPTEPVTLTPTEPVTTSDPGDNS